MNIEKEKKRRERGEKRNRGKEREQAKNKENGEKISARMRQN